MKKIIMVVFMCLLINTIAYGETKPAAKTNPKVEAQGAVLMDFETGRVLWEKNANAPLAMASTTKIMTAIITLENGNLQDIVKVSHRAAIAPEVKMELKKDEEIKLEYLLYALMLQSSNDAAVAIAEHVGGNVEEFCKMMTDKAKEIGAKDTIFETPNGLDKGDHHSTAYDMALITRYALNNPEFIRITNTKQVTVNSNKRSYSITNKNRLLSEFEGANGVKTGFTGKAGQCFVGAAKRDNMQLISVVLASGWGDKGKEQKWRDTKEILGYGFGTFKYRDVVTENVVADYVNIERSKTDKVGIYYSDKLRVPLSDEENDSIKIVIEAPELMRAPIEKDQKLGTAKILIGEDVYKEIDLLAEASASRHDLKTSMEKVGNEWLQMGTTKDVKIQLPEF